MNKMTGVRKLKTILARLKKKGKKMVFTNGCFDILHAGHIKLFSKAGALGDVLVIGINSDSSVRKLKGKKRPIQNLKDRVLVLSALECVDFVVSFDEETPDRLIRELRPDILVKGGDYKLCEIVGREYVKKVVRVKLEKGISTTGIIKKIIKAN